MVFSWLPGLQAVGSYRREWLARDVVAGVVPTTLLVVLILVLQRWLPKVPAVHADQADTVISQAEDCRRRDREHHHDQLVSLADTISTASAFAARR